MKKTISAGIGLCAIAIAFAAKDPIIMTVNGEDVPKSEFEYLYNKNSQQQINPQTLDEYVEMFKLYKMKVADAKAEGLDTMPSFLKEIEQYRHDLAAPYLADSVYINQLVNDEYDRLKEEVEAYHIMFFKSRDNAQNTRLRHRADSLQKVLRNGGDFAALAKEYSMDKGSNSKGGYMGYILANAYPYAFEEAAFTLPEGAISEVVESPQGYHILKGGKHRKARGKVQVRHILKLTQGKDEAGQAKALNQIDSIYNIVSKNPDLFSTVAQSESEDPGSGRNGGLLPWFGTGEMVAAFDSVAFSLKDGEISKPFATPYGYHIVNRLASKDIPDLSEVKPNIISKITNHQDPRFRMIRDRQTQKLSKKFKGSINEKTLAAMKADLSRAGFDSLFYANWTQMPNGSQPIAVVKGKATPAKDFMVNLSKVRESDVETANQILADRLDAFYNLLLVTEEEDALAESEPDYRNLLKEYVDGSLLYEVSVKKVWDRAAQDTEGLNAFFERNRANYRWTEPHVKGYLVQTTNDSISDLIRARAKEIGKDSLVNTIRKEFSPNVSIDKVLLSKGSNPMVDYLVFGGEEVKPSYSKYTSFFMIDPRMLTEPEDVNDVKGLVTSDYQNEFQEKWENELRSKYPVTVNEKVLRQVKPTK